MVGVVNRLTGLECRGRGRRQGQASGVGVTIRDMTPEAALLRVIHCLDRAQASGFKAKAFTRALDVVRTTPADEIEARASSMHLSTSKYIKIILTNWMNSDQKLKLEEK